MHTVKSPESIKSAYFEYGIKTFALDTKEELIKIKDDLNYQKGFLKSVEAKLSNKSFSENAPEIVINKELKKKNDALSKIKVLKERLKKLDR